MSYAESGAVLGQTVSQLNIRYKDQYPAKPTTHSKSYLLGVIDIDTAYYLHVTFDPATNKATKATLEYSAEYDAWSREITAK